MSAITISADGNYIFHALDDDSGIPLVLRAERPISSGTPLSWEEAYIPGDGTAVNVVNVPANVDQMLFYGNFGTDVGIISHTISTTSNDDISPASLGAEVVNCLTVNPSDANEIICTIDTSQDLLYTSDGGASWAVLNSDPLGFAPTGLVVTWEGGGEPHKVFVAGNDGSTVLFFSPNEGSALVDMAGIGLAAVANISGIEAGYVA